MLFQFTPLREGRLALATCLAGSGHEFQFTPLREGRREAQTVIEAQAISIHAPPRGATSQSTMHRIMSMISIHAPPRGATPSQSTAPPRARYFNSRPSARGDGYPLVAIATYLNFNSRPSARGDMLGNLGG